LRVLGGIVRGSVVRGVSVRWLEGVAGTRFYVDSDPIKMTRGGLLMGTPNQNQFGASGLLVGTPNQKIKFEKGGI